MTPEPNKLLKYVFSAPDYPWHGVSGAELVHATLDPVRAETWLKEGAKGRLVRIMQRFSDPGESAPSLSEWSVWIRIWITHEPEPRPYVVLPASATVLARTMRQRPGEMWQRIREQLLWQPQTMEDAQKLIDRISAGQRDVPFSTFYLWARVARWYDQHEHEPDNPPVPNTWTDQLARQCLRDRGFWDSYSNADDLVALDDWLTTKPLENNPTLDELLARYTHWLAQNQGPHSTGTTTMLDEEWINLARAWMEEFQGTPAYGRDLSWLAQTHKLVPSLERGKDPMTFRSLMMMALSGLVKQGKIIPQSTGQQPWDTAYVLSPEEIEALLETQKTVAAAQVQPERREKVSEDGEASSESSSKSFLDPRWARLIEIWSQDIGSEAVSLNRILTLIRRDDILLSLAPENPLEQRQYVRNTVIPRLSELRSAFKVSRQYLSESRKSVYSLSSGGDDDTILDSQVDENQAPATEANESADEPLRQELKPEEIERFLDGWWRTFGQKKVRLIDLLTKGREQGWILPVQVPLHFNPSHPHPLTVWLKEHLDRTVGQYHIESRSKGYSLVLATTPNIEGKTPSAAQPSVPSEPVALTREASPSTAPGLEENPAALIERLSASDPESVFWSALTPWISLLRNTGPEWFAEWPHLDSRVFDRIRHLWPVLISSLNQTNKERQLTEENERLKRLLGEKELRLAQASDLLKENGFVPD